MSVSNPAAYNHPTPWDTVFEPATLPDMFVRTARQRGDAPFLHFLGRTYTYKSVLADADVFACRLRALGIKKGDRVGLFLPNVPIYASAYYGAMMAGTELMFLDKEDYTKLAPEGEPGELAVHGPQIMRGYWNREEASAEVLIEREGKVWLRTGDVAVIDQDGFLQIVDRIKDMIAVGGFKVFPSQVEHVIVQNEAIKEALVIGVPNDYLGEMPRAFVTLNKGAMATAEELASWVNDRVGKHERVDLVVIRDELPKTLIGKLDRKALRAEVL